MVTVTVRYLCDQGADVHARDALNNTALHYSVAKGNLDCV